MQLARIIDGAQEEFAVRQRDTDHWVPISGLGIDARSTRDVIEHWDELVSALPQSRAAIAPDIALGCPVVAPGKILAIGLNYLDHIKETGATRPERPIVFAKYPSSLAGPAQDTLHDPSLTAKLDYEAELAVVIGRPSRRLTRDTAMDAVFGYAVANDISARDLQVTDAQFSRSKSFDTFCPIGPWITTADGVPSPEDLSIRSSVNGEARQNSSTGQMLFGIVDLLVFLSSTMTLWPGDVILTGTPPGVGLGFNPPRFLAAGDVVECAIEGLGSIRNRVVLDASG